MRADAKRRARDSNPQPASRHLISSQQPLAENPEESANFDQRAAPGAAVGADQDFIDPDLTAVTVSPPQARSVQILPSRTAQEVSGDPG